MIILIIQLAILVSGCEAMLYSIDSSKLESNCTQGYQPIKLINNEKTYDICVEIADDYQERSKGLMNREILSTNEGMLFVFDNESTQSFWMKNTLISLDLLFFDKQMNLVDYKDDFEPCREEECESYTSKKPAKYVLEINSDVLEENNYKLQMTSY